MSGRACGAGVVPSVGHAESRAINGGEGYGRCLSHGVVCPSPPQRPHAPCGRMLRLPLDEEHETLGDLLKRRAEEGVCVRIMVWDDTSSIDDENVNKMLEFTKEGMMGVKDEETAAFFRDTGPAPRPPWRCLVGVAVLCPLGQGLRWRGRAAEGGRTARHRTVHMGPGGGRDHAFPSHMQEGLCEAHSTGQWDGGLPPLVLLSPSSCNVQGGILSSGRRHPSLPRVLGCLVFSLCCGLDGEGCALRCALHKCFECLREAFGVCRRVPGKGPPNVKTNVTDATAQQRRRWPMASERWGGGGGGCNSGPWVALGVGAGVKHGVMGWEYGQEYCSLP